MKILPRTLPLLFIACSIALTAPASANIPSPKLDFPVNSVSFYKSPLVTTPFQRSLTYDPVPNCADAASKLIGMGIVKLENGMPVAVVCKTGISGVITHSVCATDGINRSFCISGNATSEPQNLWDAARSILEAYRNLEQINRTGNIQLLQPR